MKKIIGILIGISIVSSVYSIEGNNSLPLVPYPARVELQNGRFSLSQTTRLAIRDNGKFGKETGYWQQLMQELLGQGLLQSNAGDENTLVIEFSDEPMPSGGYRLDITPVRVILSSPHADGIFYAMQTLKQLLFSAQIQERQPGQKVFSLPCLSIVDAPSYEWRGLMLDVARHFFSVEYLKKQVDMLAYYKMNRLHLHLTDDQGWRIEIRKYPELTQKGAWRTFNRQDSMCMESAKINPDFALDPRFIIHPDGAPPLYGGYYTQDEMRDLIRYAQKRHVEIIPEIDMPGHMMMAISLYPELSCTGSVGWGKTFSYPLCPCNETTFTFLENILDEIADLFPSRLIHIGVDEVEKNTWATSEACKKLMEEKGYKHVEQLQTYFAKRIQTYLEAKGKEVIAWDEVLEDTVNSNVNVMFWRDWVGGVPEKAVANGNRIIFVPVSPLYFSRRDSSLYPIYNLQAKFDAVSPDKRSLIRGAQACIWAERVPSENAANSSIYPRLLALSEAVWTPEGARDWHAFKQRLTSQFAYLDTEHIKHPTLTYALIPSISVDKTGKEIRIELESEQVDPVIYYTTDGSVPTKNANRYKNRISVSGSAEICAAVYDKGMIQQPVLRRSIDYHKAINKPVTYHTMWNKAYPANRENTLTDGLRGGERYNDRFWQGFTTDLDITVDLQEVTPVRSFSAMFMQSVGPGVYMPAYVEVSLSEDGLHFEKVLTINNEVPETERALVIRKFSGEIKKAKKARYVKVFAKNKAGHFMFTDELVIY